VAVALSHGAEPPDAEAQQRLAAPTAPGRTTRLARIGAATVLAGGLALAGWQLASAAFDSAESSEIPAASPTAAASSAPVVPPGARISIVAVRDFDPEGRDGQEHRADAPKAVDGKPGTFWSTDLYRRPELGNLKSGVGLIVDLGRAQHVGTITLDLVSRGTDLEVRAADQLGAQASDYRVVASAVEAGTLVTLRPDQSLTTRYLLVWLKSLPEVDDGYRGGISEITVRS
jgi:hypothetical protein